MPEVLDEPEEMAETYFSKRDNRRRCVDDVLDNTRSMYGAPLLFITVHQIK